MATPEEQLRQQVADLEVAVRDTTRAQRIGNFLSLLILGVSGYQLWRHLRDDDPDSLVLVVGADTRDGARGRSLEG